MTGARIDGAAKLMRELRSLGPRARRTKRRAMSATGKTLVTAFKANAKVRTGATRRSIGIQRMKDDSIRVGVRERFVDGKTRKVPSQYARKVEAKTPWFLPTWEGQKDVTAKRIITELKNSITKERAM